MANKYRTTIKQIAKEVIERDDFREIFIEHKFDLIKRNTINIVLEIVMDEIKKELIELGTVSINKFGSFSIKLRKRGNYFIKFNRYKKIKEFIKDNINNNELFNQISLSFEQFKVKVANNSIGLESLSSLISEKIKVDKFNSDEEYVLTLIVMLFATIEEEAYKLKTVHISRFGSFYLNVNKKFGIYFRFVTDNTFKQYLDSGIIGNRK